MKPFIFSLRQMFSHSDLSLGILSINKYLSIYCVQDTVLGAVGDQRNPRGKPFSPGIYNFVEGLAFLCLLQVLSMEFIIQIIVGGLGRTRGNVKMFFSKPSNCPCRVLYFKAFSHGWLGR